MQKIALAAITMLMVVACSEGGAQQSMPQPQVAPMHSSVGSANYVAAGCRDFIARRPDSPYAQGLCAGKVEAIAVFATGICYPAEVTVGQMIRVVVRYIDERPARLHENFLILADEAMRAAWPCRR